MKRLLQVFSITALLLLASSFIPGQYTPPPNGGGGGSGANANGYYLVNRSTNAPTNAINLGSLSTGVVTATVSGGVATITTTTAYTGPSTQTVTSNTTGNVYHNTGSTPRFVSITFLASSTNDGITINTDSNSSPTTEVAEVTSTTDAVAVDFQITAWILPGNYYEAVVDGSVTVEKWTEWQ